MSKPGKSRILVPIDFSEQSLVALKQTYNLARFVKAGLLLVHVIDKDVLEALGRFFKDNAYEDPLRDQAQERLDKLAAETQRESGLVVNTTIRQGKVYDEIVALSKQEDVTFIVMGTHGTVGLRKRFVGSNAMRVIKEADCPVITIKGTKHQLGCKKIVLPLDLTKETREKVDKAVELAGYFGATIHVISVMESGDEFLVNKLTRQLDQVTAFIEKRGIPVKSKLLQDRDIAEAVVTYAEAIEADLIVIMTQQEIYWTELFIGFAAQEIINHSLVPVLSIRPTMTHQVEFVLS